MKMFAISTHIGGAPAINTTDPSTPPYTPCTGWVQCGIVGQYGAYLFSSTAAQLVAINALPNVVGIVAVSESGTVRWAELDGVIAAGVRTKLNAWLTARGYPTIPAGWTYRQVVMAICKRLNAQFDLTTHDVMDAES